jgi:hypothetical protein
MPAVNGVGKPGAGEPHARFDGRELETEHLLAMVTVVGQPAGKPQEHKATGPTASGCHRASSRPSCPRDVPGGAVARLRRSGRISRTTAGKVGPRRGAGLSTGLLRCAMAGQARSLIPVGQIARVSSSKAVRTRRLTPSSTPSSSCPRRMFWMNACPVVITRAQRSCLRPRIGRSRDFRRP